MLARHFPAELLRGILRLVAVDAAEVLEDLRVPPGNGLEKLKGKWATQRKHHSLADVAAAGGWKDTETLLTCCQQPDTETLLAVMSEEREVRDAAFTSPKRRETAPQAAPPR